MDLATDPLKRRSFVVTLGLLTAVAALTIDMSLPAIPAMVKALATDLTRGQQIVGVFMLGMALSQIPIGLLSDRAGRLPALYTGMGIFAIGGIAAAIAKDIEWMLAARFVQGLGASSGVVIARAIVRDVASGQEAARMMSLMTMIFTAAPVVAPSIGALLITQWGWRAPFVTIAACSVVMLLAIRNNLLETHPPNKDGHPVAQLKRSFAEYFSHRQSVFALLLLILPPIGFMSIIATSAALAMEIYDHSVRAYGLIFALAGLSILIGAAVNRWLVARFTQLALIRLGVGLIGIAGYQLLLIAWLESVPFWWIWSCVCLFMFTVAILMANATVVALDPLPRIAGVASSIIGTSQNAVGAGAAVSAAMIYDGSVRNTVILMGLSGAAVTLVYMLRPLLAPGNLVHHGEEVTRPSR